MLFRKTVQSSEYCKTEVLQMRPINDVSGHNEDTDVLIVQNGMKAQSKTKD